MIRRKKLKRPSELLNLYNQKLSSTLEERLSSLSFELEFSYRSPHIATISGYIVFRNGWILEFDEVIVQIENKVQRDKYRYHVMNKEKELIFRYDNVPHFPDIDTFPHHKHINDQVLTSHSPMLLEIIDEIERLIIHQ